jgi:carbamoyl-phosphate synthase large subunit
MGGQTALNCALDLDARRAGKVRRRDDRRQADAIDKAEDRKLFDQAMRKHRPGMPARRVAHNMEEAFEHAGRWSASPASSVRPSPWAARAAASPTTAKSSWKSASAVWTCRRPSELLIDESLIGWKEYEMEVVRDKNDNCIIVCSIENFDAMGVHTGDSITVAPAQTLTDKEYQIMRNASIAVLREIGVETGGSNVQFGISPKPAAWW